MSWLGFCWSGTVELILHFFRRKVSGRIPQGGATGRHGGREMRSRGNDYVGGRLDPFPGAVHAGVGVDGTDDGIGRGANVLGALHEMAEGEAKVTVAPLEEMEGVGVTVNGAGLQWSKSSAMSQGLCQCRNSSSMASRSGWRQMVQRRSWWEGEAAVSFDAIGCSFIFQAPVPRFDFEHLVLLCFAYRGKRSRKIFEIRWCEGTEKARGLGLDLRKACTGRKDGKSAFGASSGGAATAAKQGAKQGEDFPGWNGAIIETPIRRHDDTTLDWADGAGFEETE